MNPNSVCISCPVFDQHAREVSNPLFMDQLFKCKCGFVKTRIIAKQIGIVIQVTLSLA